MEEKKKELVTFLRWMQEEPDIFWKLTLEDRANATMCLELIEAAIQREHYLLIPLILGRTQSRVMEDVIYRLFFRKIADWLENGDEETIIKEIRELLLKAVEEEKKKKIGGRIMRYGMFVQELSMALQEKLGEEYVVKNETVTKTNNQNKKTLAVGYINECVHMAIYPEQEYRRYLETDL